MLEIWFFISFLLSPGAYGSDTAILGDYYQSFLSEEVCKETREEFVDEVADPAEEEGNGLAHTTRCLSIHVSDEGIEI